MRVLDFEAHLLIFARTNKNPVQRPHSPDAANLVPLRCTWLSPTAPEAAVPLSHEQAPWFCICTAQLSAVAGIE